MNLIYLFAPMLVLVIAAIAAVAYIGNILLVRSRSVEDEAKKDEDERMAEKGM